MKDTKLLDCVSSPRGFCLQADLQAFCSYLNRVAIWAEYWSVSSEGIWGQYQINLSRDCTDTLVYICLSYLKEKRMHPQPSLPLSSNRNNLSEKGKKFLLRAANSLLPDLSSCTTVILKAKEQHPISVRIQNNDPLGRSSPSHFNNIMALWRLLPKVRSL